VYTWIRDTWRSPLDWVGEDVPHRRSRYNSLASGFPWHDPAVVG
jgi:hypothetical protein